MPRPKSAIPSHDLLQAALEGLEIQKQRLEDQIQRVQSMLGKRRGRPAAAEAAAASGPRRRRRLSAAGRKRIAEAQRRRWAAQRKNSGAEKKAAK